MRFSLCLGVLSLSMAAGAQQPATESPSVVWPQFRGPNASGISERGDFPIEFGPETNMLWKVELPPGHSSPCLWGDRIFITGFSENRLKTICLQSADGAVLWEKELPPTRIEAGSRNSSPATATPATDGRRVFVYFGSFGLAAYSPTGAEEWRKPLPVPVTQHGAGTSPVVAGDLVLLNVDQDVGSYLLAVRAGSGETVWRTERPGFRRGFSTPVLCPATNPSLAIIAGTLQAVAYRLSDGSAAWRVAGLPNEMVSTPVLGDGLLFISGWTYGAGARVLPQFQALLEKEDHNGDGKLSRAETPAGPARNNFLYIDANKDGQITKDEWDSIARIFTQSENALQAFQLHGEQSPELLWKQTRGLPYVPSPLYDGGRIFLIKNGGLASCFDAHTGKVLYQEERIGALGDYYSSPVAAHGKICVASEQGMVVVLAAGDQLRVLARNRIGEPILATPAIGKHTLYVRTLQHLYAFRPPAPVVRD